VQLAFTEETALDIRRTIENVKAMSETMTGFVQQQTQTYAGVSRNVLSATQNIQTASQSVTRMAGEVEQQMPLMIANARQASQNLEELSRRLQDATQGVPALVARADTTLTAFGKLAVSADQVLQTVQPQVKELGPTLVEARAAMYTLQTSMAALQSGDGTLGRLINDPALYEEMQASIATLRRIMADVQANPERYIGAVKIF
jgi:phospholipid/cholesterol/gamma-HCH transport system substrate-binding protein